METTTTGVASPLKLDYTEVQTQLQATFDANFAKYGPTLFTTATKNLSTKYLESFVEDERQQHNCECCLSFLRRHGGLVFLTPEGVSVPALWDPETAPEGFRATAQALHDELLKRPVTGAYIGPDETWGRPQQGSVVINGEELTWTHMALNAPAAVRHRKPVAERGERRERVVHLSQFLPELTLPVLNNAILFLQGEGVNQSARFINQATWLRDTFVAVEKLKGRQRSIAIMQATASAPAGWSETRKSVVGNIISGLQQKKTFGQIKSLHNFAVRADTYQRSQGELKAGNVQSAEKLIADLNLGPSMPRRLAQMAEILPHAFWTPPPAAVAEPVAPAGVFGHVPTKDTKAAAVADTPLAMPPVEVSWVKFLRDVLPKALKVEQLLVNGNDRLCSFTAAADPEALPLMRWDTAEHRNTFSWFTWTNGCPPEYYGFKRGTYQEVIGFTYNPSCWADNGNSFQEHPELVIALFAGGKITEPMTGCALFPTHVPTALHSIRATIEHYSRNTPIQGQAEADCFGCYTVQLEGQPATLLRVTTAEGVLRYNVNRYE